MIKEIYYGKKCNYIYLSEVPPCCHRCGIILKNSMIYKNNEFKTRIEEGVYCTACSIKIGEVGRIGQQYPVLYIHPSHKPKNIHQVIPHITLTSVKEMSNTEPCEIIDRTKYANRKENTVELENQEPIIKGIEQKPKKNDLNEWEAIELLYSERTGKPIKPFIEDEEPKKLIVDVKRCSKCGREITIKPAVTTLKNIDLCNECYTNSNQIELK